MGREVTRAVSGGRPSVAEALRAHASVICLYLKIDLLQHWFAPVRMMEKAVAPPLQYSCLENPMDGGAWKAAVHGVAEGRT